ncbi:MAG: hypothetical protein H7X95_08070, partial [Deltaproteobacteria bacterium]|nr:hypothetical protein [Deltaproteobacteria bacterium]
MAADDRAPVRVGTLDALTTFARTPGCGLALVTAASDWLLTEDLDNRLSAAALVIEVLNDRRLVTALAAEPSLLSYLERAVIQVAEAPRSAERLDGRRRLLMSLPPTLATVVATLGSGDVGP